MLESFTNIPTLITQIFKKIFQKKYSKKIFQTTRKKNVQKQSNHRNFSQYSVFKIFE